MDKSEAGRALARFRKRVTAACERCGTSFETYDDKKRGRFCSPKCRQAAWVAQDPERERQRLRDYRAKRRARPGAEAGRGEGE